MFAWHLRFVLPAGSLLGCQLAPRIVPCTLLVLPDCAVEVLSAGDLLHKMATWFERGLLQWQWHRQVVGGERTTSASTASPLPLRRANVHSLTHS
jgi:hypothetical protein